MKDGSLADHIFHLLLCPGIDMELEPGFHKVTYHGLPHDPNPDKTNLMHVFSSSCSYIYSLIQPATSPAFPLLPLVSYRYFLTARIL